MPQQEAYLSITTIFLHNLGKEGIQAPQGCRVLSAKTKPTTETEEWYLYQDTIEKIPVKHPGSKIRRSSVLTKGDQESP
jgi:hypothetical protein